MVYMRKSVVTTFSILFLMSSSLMAQDISVSCEKKNIDGNKKVSDIENKMNKVSHEVDKLSNLCVDTFKVNKDREAMLKKSLDLLHEKYSASEKGDISFSKKYTLKRQMFEKKETLKFINANKN